MTYDELLDKCFDIMLGDLPEDKAEAEIAKLLDASEHKDKVLETLAVLFIGANANDKAN